MTTRQKLKPIINITNETDNQVNEDIFYPVLETVVIHENQAEDSIVNLLITDSANMAKYNKRYRGIDQPTDVIAFPATISDVPILGDIIIDISTAISQKGKKDIDKELEELFLHGLLHLLDYDHISQKQQEIMRSKEEKYILEENKK